MSATLDRRSRILALQARQHGAAPLALPPPPTPPARRELPAILRHLAACGTINDRQAVTARRLVRLHRRDPLAFDAARRAVGETLFGVLDVVIVQGLTLAHYGALHSLHHNATAARLTDGLALLAEHFAIGKTALRDRSGRW